MRISIIFILEFICTLAYKYLIVKKIVNKSLVLLVSIVLLQSCVSTKNISSFQCSYEGNGQSRSSESIILRPVITTVDGTQLTPLDPNSTQLIARSESRTSKTLKEYKIEVIGGTRLGNSAIIEVDKNNPEIINKRLQVFISLKKEPSFTDTIDYLIDYKGRLSLNYDATNYSSHAADIFVDVVKIEDSIYRLNFNCDLFKITVSSGSSSKAYLISENDASLFISNRGANGSNGSNGANGKNGAPGKDGADGFKGKNGEIGGDGGDGGNGGNGGNGGRITITLDSNCIHFKNLVNYNNLGGHGGIGGKGGIGGAGGKGGVGGHRIVGGNILGERKASGNTGASGRNGRDGINGSTGEAGPPIIFVYK